MVTLRQIIEITCLRQARVLARPEWLSREVSSLHIIDHPDIANWVKARQLLMTTGVNWPKGHEQQTLLIRQLAERQVTAILLAVPQYLPHFPLATLEAANHWEIALLEAPWDLPFHQINEEVFSFLLEQHAQLLEHSDRIHRELSRVAIHADSLDELAQTLTTQLQRKVSFTDLQGRFIGTCESEGQSTPVSFSPGLEEIVQMLKNRGDLESIHSSEHPVHIESVPELSFNHHAACPIRIHNELVGIVWLPDEPKPLNKLEVKAVEHAAIIAALHISWQRQMVLQESRLGYELLDSLLEGRLERGMALEKRLSLAGLPSSIFWRLCLVIIDEPTPLTREGFQIRERCAEDIRHQLQKRDAPVLMSVQSNLIYFLLPITHAPETLYHSLNNRLCSVLVSEEQNDLTQLPRLNQELLTLIPHIEPRQLRYSNSFILPRIFSGDRAAKIYLKQKIMTPLTNSRNGKALLNTLSCLSRHSFNLNKSARTLHIHIGTLRYRMGIIEQKTGMNLNDPDERFLIDLVFRLTENDAT
ncbi:PucR family transcriptional regulator [Salmonella enterica subsp. enterica serovar Saintpaul]|nr:PucR family transcriptional regulator [Salmonella enterica subsp. enterica serovar Saintpaul]